MGRKERTPKKERVKKEEDKQIKRRERKKKREREKREGENEKCRFEMYSFLNGRIVFHATLTLKGTFWFAYSIYTTFRERMNLIEVSKFQQNTSFLH